MLRNHKELKIILTTDRFYSITPEMLIVRIYKSGKQLRLVNVFVSKAKDGEASCQEFTVVLRVRHRCPVERSCHEVETNH